MANPYFNDPAYGWNESQYNPSQLPGALSGSTGSIGGGPLAGGGGWQARAMQFLDPQVALPMAAALIGGANPQQSLAGAFQVAGQAVPGMNQRAAMNAWLKARSTGQPLSPEMQQVIQSDPALASKLAIHDLGLDAGAGGEGEYGLTPIYGVDKNGQAVVMQPRRSGGLAPAALPEGVTLSKKPLELDAGTHTILLDPVTRQVIGDIPKNVAGAASEKAIGEAQGAAAVNLPVVEDAARRLTGTIDKALATPDEISRVTGPLQSWLPNVSGTAHAGQATINQIQGQAFLQAYQQLKGGGAITDTEGGKATAALNKLSETGVNDDKYIEYLKDFRDEVQKLVVLARRKAAGAGAGGVPAASTQGGGAPADPFGIR